MKNRLLPKMKAAIGRFIKGVTNAIDLRDVFVFSGLGALGYGISLMHVPAAWIVVGSIVFMLGMRR